MYESRSANRSKTFWSSSSPVPTIESRARLTSCSSVQSSTATPTIGHSSRPRFSSRYSERKVITLARSPLIPKATKTSAGTCSVAPGAAFGAFTVDSALVVISDSFSGSYGSRRPRPRCAACRFRLLLDLHAPAPVRVDPSPTPRDVEQLEVADPSRERGVDDQVV